MAKIPNASNIQRALPSGAERVISPDISSAGRGTAALSGALINVASDIEKRDMRDRQSTFDDAELQMAIALEKESNAYNQDPEWATIGERSDLSMNSALGTIASNITNAEDRERFTSRQKLNMERTRSRLGKVSFSKERDHFRGKINGQLDDAREASLTGDTGGVSELVGGWASGHCSAAWHNGASARQVPPYGR